MQSPKYSSEEEELLMSRLWAPGLKNDPLAWIMFVFPWGQPGTPLANYKSPRKWQRDVLNALKAHLQGQITAADYKTYRDATCSGRGIGKTALESWIALWFFCTRIGSTTLVSANSEAQLKGVFWSELVKWNALLICSHWIEPSATQLTPAKWLATIVEDELKIGTKAWVVQGRLWSEENPDAYAGVHSDIGILLLFDEASGIPDAIWSVAAGFFTEMTPNRLWLAFSNGRRPSGYFFDCFHEKAQFWNTRNVDGRDVEGIDQAVYQQIIEEYGAESVQAFVEVYGMFPPTGEEQFISPIDVEDAMGRLPWDDVSAGIVMGVDPASGRGRDHTAYVIRQGRNLLHKERNHNEDTMETVGRVIALKEEYDVDLVIVDDGGLGIGVIDRLKEQKFKWVRNVDFGWNAKNRKMWSNKKAELWGAMKAWVKTASMPFCKVMKRDLTTPERRFDSKGAMKVESKKDIKARHQPSPDYADALACTFAYPVAGRSTTGKRTLDSRNLKGYNVTPSSPVNTGWMSH